jgi:TPR repeat protein
MNNKRDLLIHYDEDRQKFIFYMVDVDQTSALRAKTFDGVCPDVAFFKEKSPDEAERILGSSVFAALDHGSITKVGIRDYKTESEAAMQTSLVEAKIAAENGDPEAQFDLYMHFHMQTLKFGLQSDLDSAEQMLLASVKAGYPHAIKALEDWPLLKEAAESRIRRGTRD